MSWSYEHIPHVDIDHRMVPSFLEESEHEWTRFILELCGISPVIIDRIDHGEITASEWREYLVMHGRLEVCKNVTSGDVYIYQIPNEANVGKIKIAEWNRPQVARLVEQPHMNRVIFRWWKNC